MIRKVLLVLAIIVAVVIVARFGMQMLAQSVVQSSHSTIQRSVLSTGTPTYRKTMSSPDGSDTIYSWSVSVTNSSDQHVSAFCKFSLLDADGLPVVTDNTTQLIHANTTEDVTGSSVTETSLFDEGVRATVACE